MLESTNTCVTTLPCNVIYGGGLAVTTESLFFFQLLL